MPITKPGQPIDLGYARKLADNYQKNKISSILPEDETRAVWFSKETILTALGLDPATSTKNITGLRIYLGAYAAHDGYPSNPYDVNKITLILVQTGLEKITIERGAVEEIAYLDIINDPTAQPGYPGEVTPATGAKTTYNDGQMAPPFNDLTGFGLLDW